MYVCIYIIKDSYRLIKALLKKLYKFVFQERMTQFSFAIWMKWYAGTSYGKSCYLG